MRFATCSSLAVCFFALQVLPLAAHASPCSRLSIKGTYGLQSTVTQDNEVPPTFLELVGTLQFDGLGSALERYTYASGTGSVGTDSATMVYNVAPDCTFTMTQDNGETFSGVIVNNGVEFYFIETSGACCGSSIIRRGHAKRLNTSN